MKINFYLKDKNSTGKTPILILFNYNGKRLKYYSGISIKPKSWNKSSGKICSGVSGSVGLNATLKKMEYELSESYRKIINEKKSIPEPAYFRAILDNNFKNTIQTGNKEFFDYYDIFINAKQEEGVDIKRYKGLRSHLKAIEQKIKVKLSFETFSRSFYKKYIDYFVSIKHANKTIRDRHLKDIKAYFNWCVLNEHIEKNNFTGIKFPYQVSDPFEIALDKKELKTLHDLDLSKNIRLQNVRDLFLIECYTGVRFSDLNKITPENIKGDELHIYTEETRENNVVIPLRPDALEVINRYHSKGLELPLKTNQKTNEYLKELGRIAGLNDAITWVVLSGRNKIVHKKKRYEKLQTHTGRRTFITTNIERGLTPLQIMSITTHRTYSEFQKYYKPERLNIKQQYLNAWLQVNTKYNTSELIKRLLINNVDKNKIALSFGVNSSEIDELTSN